MRLRVCGSGLVSVVQDVSGTMSMNPCDFLIFFAARTGYGKARECGIRDEGFTLKHGCLGSPKWWGHWWFNSYNLFV